MDNTSNIPLVDILLLAEKNVERRLAVCLALHPKEVLILSEKSNVTPEIDAEVVEFWEKVQRQKMNNFYTAETAIRGRLAEGFSWV